MNKDTNKNKQFTKFVNHFYGKEMDINSEENYLKTIRFNEK